MLSTPSNLQRVLPHTSSEFHNIYKFTQYYGIYLDPKIENQQIKYKSKDKRESLLLTLNEKAFNKTDAIKRKFLALAFWFRFN